MQVIEHMEEDQASLFGNIGLSSFRPTVLIVSTPNYEYNPILQRSAMPNKEDEPEENAGPCKFRNHDHKFEWTTKIMIQTIHKLDHLEGTVSIDQQSMMEI